MDQLRALVNAEGWDCCVVWRLRNNQRSIEWLNCCCVGAEYHPQELTSSFTGYLCRDAKMVHPRTKTCDLLAQMPHFMHVDESGVYVETLLSAQSRWFHFSDDLEGSADMEVNVATRLLIPVRGGLVELFAAKQVCENKQIMEYVTENCSIPTEQDFFVVNSTTIDAICGDHLLTDPSIAVASSPFFSDEFMSHLCNSNVEDALFQDMGSMLINETKNTGRLEQDANYVVGKNIEQVGHDMETGNNDQLGRSDSISECSDQFDEAADTKYRKKNGKGPQSKNLIAERKRRKKLNERLYKLRSLVPIISKLDRASILGDAIDFVMELQKQKKDLEEELQEKSDEDDNKNTDSFPRENRELTTTDKGQQTEARVEVKQVEGCNELFVKLLCEHKPGGVVRLLEALDSCELEVKNVTVASFGKLVSNVLQVQKKRGSSKAIEADSVKNLLVEIVSNPSGVTSLETPYGTTPSFRK